MNIPLNFNPLGFASAAVEPSELPAGYTRLAFVENEATAYAALGEYNLAGLGCEIISTPPSGNGYEVAFGFNSNSEYFTPLLAYNGMLGGCRADSTAYWTISGDFVPRADVPAGEGVYADSKITARHNFYDSGTTEFYTGAHRLSSSLPEVTGTGFFGVFLRYTTAPRPEASWKGGIYSLQLTSGDSLIAELIPAVTPSGDICFYDKISGIDYANVNPSGGSFIAGFETLDQLQQLAANLPPVTDTPEIKLSLPGEWNGDASANAQLSIITGKGWSTTISYRDVETSTSSSFVLGNRGDGGSALVLWCRAVESDSGNYQDADGVRYYVETCHDIWHPAELSPDDLGYTAVLTLEDYLTERGLTAIEYPEEELTA